MRLLSLRSPFIAQRSAFSVRRSSARSRRFLLLLLAIAALAFLLRLGICFQLASVYPPATAPAAPSDMWTYLTLARQVVEGTYDYAKGFRFQPFYYTVFLPAIHRLLGPAPGWLFLVQALLAAGCVFLTGLTFARLFGRWAGLAAAALLALARYHAFYTAFALVEVLQGFWMCLLAYLCVRAWERPALWRWAGAGLVLGLAAVTRGNAILLAPAVLLAIVFRHRRELGRLTAAVGLFLLLAALPGLPYAWVNARAFGFWIGPSSDAAQVLALGNSPEAPPGGRDPGTGAGAMEFTESVTEWVRLDHLRGPDRVPAWKSLVRWVAREPLAWLELKFRVALLFWTGYEIPNNVALEDWDPRTGGVAPVAASLLQAPILLDFGVLGTLGLAGLMLSLNLARRRPRVALLIALLALYCLSTVLFYMLGRFRVPAVPWVCGFGGFVLVRAAGTVRAALRQLGTPRELALRSLRLLLALVLAALAVGYAFESYRRDSERLLTRWARPDGVRIELPGRAVVRDNGPRCFGGWTPLEMPVAPLSLEITKDFAAAMPPGGTADIRLAILAPAGGRLALVAGGREAVVEVPPGLNWLTLPAVPLDLLDVAPPLERGRPRPHDAATPPAAAPVDAAAPPLERGRPRPHDAANPASRCRLRLTVARLGPAPVSLVFDAQRGYSRTTLNRDFAPPGELVVDLILPRR